MKITVKIVQDKSEISIEGENSREIIEKLDEVKKIIKKLESISSETPEPETNTREDSPIESREWETEY